jgi:hypothetical protein
LVGENKGNEMVMECSTHGRHEISIKFLFLKPEGNYTFVKHKSRLEYKPNTKIHFKKLGYKRDDRIYLAKDRIF